MVYVGDKVYNFILNLVIFFFVVVFEFIFLWLIFILDYVVYRFLKDFVELDMRKLSIIIVGLFFVSSFMFVVLVIFVYIVVVWLWSLYIR